VKKAKFEYFRNLRNLPFPQTASEGHLKEVVNKVSEAVNNINKLENSFVQMERLSFDNFTQRERIIEILRENRVELHRNRIDNENNNSHIYLIILSEADSSQSRKDNVDTNINHLLLLNDNSHVRIITSTNNHIHLAYSRLNSYIKFYLNI